MNQYYNPERLDQGQRAPLGLESIRKRIVPSSGLDVDRATEHSIGVVKNSADHFFTQKAQEQTPQIIEKPVASTPYMDAKQRLDDFYTASADADIKVVPSNVVQTPTRPTQPAIEATAITMPNNVVPIIRPTQQQTGNDFPLPYNGEYQSA